MAASPILIGGEFFREIREHNCYYIDKTSFLEELLSPVPAKVSLFTRPRRFGKTLMMTMLQEFFDIRQDSKEIFDGLAISKNKVLCDAWMNKHPSVFLSMKNVEGMSFDEAYIYFKALASRLCSDHVYLIDSPRVAELEKNLLRSILEQDADAGTASNILLTLSRALHAHWGKPAVLLIDEYDVPLARAEQNGYYDEMVTFIRNMLGAPLKTNPSLQLAVLTGCLRIAKESIFTGLNNFKCYGISDPDFAASFGFTPQEVDDLLISADLSAKKGVMQEWYDGYRFGMGQEIYCPWDILQYVVDLQKNPSAKPQAYWSNTSGNGIIRRFVDRADLHVGHKFETLLAGGCIEAEITETLTYDTVHSSEDNLWTMLYLTGYLTKASMEQQKQCGVSPDSELTPLVIPNKEILKIFTSSIASWFKDSVKQSDRTELFRALWSGDALMLTKLLRKQLYTTISYYDAREDYYHAFATGILSFSAYDVRSNVESGNGRPDILVLDIPNERAVIIEIKQCDDMAELENSANKALAQIEDRKYALGLPPIITQVIKYGIAFCNKECLVLKHD